jgi:hypothetical protein
MGTAAPVGRATDTQLSFGVRPNTPPPDAPAAEQASFSRRVRNSAWRAALYLTKFNPVLATAATAVDNGFEAVAAYMDDPEANPLSDTVLRATEEAMARADRDVQLSVNPAARNALEVDYVGLMTALPADAPEAAREAYRERIEEYQKQQTKIIEEERDRLLSTFYNEIDEAFADGGMGMSRDYLRRQLADPATRQLLRGDEEDIVTYYERVRAGTAAVDTQEAVEFLELMAERSPQQFARQINLDEFRAELTFDTLQEFREQQQELLGNGTRAVTADQARNAIQDVIAGLDPAQRAMLTRMTMSYVDAYQAQSSGGLPPSDMQMYQFAMDALNQQTVARFNEAGWGGNRSNQSLAEFYETAETMGLDVALEADEVTLAIPMADGTTQERTFSNAEMRSAAMAYSQDYGRMPSAGELIVMLSMSGSDMLTAPTQTRVPNRVRPFMDVFDARRASQRVVVPSPEEAAVEEPEQELARPSIIERAQDLLARDRAAPTTPGNRGDRVRRRDQNSARAADRQERFYETYGRTLVPAQSASAPEFDWSTLFNTRGTQGSVNRRGRPTGDLIE